ncbi:hypothetical protein [Blastococcus sp. Marseille-P5729]|uniref:hypothetical protein n=1 Tax=Blastococcus sp. Marseille-P5729 TaxID=2086582 RepID=UPI0018FEBFF9|nr:hypothetical protein [Blastococcus sp. Marseille-P5729]
MPFTLNGKELRPDGLIRVTRGSRTWTALVEVKTDKNELSLEQVDNYISIALQEGYDAVLTISNQVPPLPGTHPTPVDRRRLRRVQLAHLSWSEVLTTAVIQKEHRGVSDPEQAWILGELIRYLEYDGSGALEFTDMGSHWTSVRSGVCNNTVRIGDPGAREVAQRWDALVRFVSLQLGRRLGSEVTQVLSRAETRDPAIRSDTVLKELVEDGRLSGEIRIPDAHSTIAMVADLRSSLLTCSTVVDASDSARQRTRVMRLTKQLAGIEFDLDVAALVKNSRTPPPVVRLAALVENPDALVPDAGREIRGFRLSRGVALSTNKSGTGGFVNSVQKGVENFYDEVLSRLKIAKTTPPRTRSLPEADKSPSKLSSTDLSSQDEPDESSQYDPNEHTAPSPPTAPPTSPLSGRDPSGSRISQLG